MVNFNSSLVLRSIFGHPSAYLNKQRGTILKDHSECQKINYAETHTHKLQFRKLIMEVETHRRHDNTAKQAVKNRLFQST